MAKMEFHFPYVFFLSLSQGPRVDYSTQADVKIRMSAGTDACADRALDLTRQVLFSVAAVGEENDTTSARKKWTPAAAGPGVRWRPLHRLVLHFCDAGRSRWSPVLLATTTIVLLSFFFFSKRS